MKLVKDKLPSRTFRPEVGKEGSPVVAMTMGQLRIESPRGIPTIIVCLKTGEVAFADDLTPSEAAAEFWDTLASMAAFKNFTR